MNLISPAAKPQQPSMRHAVPSDLLRLWDQSGIEHDGRDTSWFFIPQMQEVLHMAIQANTVEGKPRLKKFGGWDWTIHQVGCMHLAYNFPGIATEEERLTTALLAGLHDCVEDPREIAKKLNRFFGEEELDAVYASAARSSKTMPVFRRVMKGLLYLTDAECFDKITDRAARNAARIPAQIDKSFDPITGECVIEPLLQRVRAVDKMDQLATDVKARSLGALPDDKLDDQVEQAIRKSYFLRFPVVVAHPEIADKYWKNVAYLEAELALTKVAALQKAVLARRSGNLTDVELEEQLIKAQRNSHVIVNRHPELLASYNDNVAVLKKEFAKTNAKKKPSLATDYCLNALLVLNDTQQAVRTTAVVVLRTGLDCVNSGYRWITGVNL